MSPGIRTQVILEPSLSSLYLCISYFFGVVIKRHDPKLLLEGRVILASGFRGIRDHRGRDRRSKKQQAEQEEQRLRVPGFNCKHDGQRELQAGAGCTLSKPPPRDASPISLHAVNISNSATN